MKEIQQKLNRQIKDWEDDPFLFFKDCWKNVVLWDKLEDIITEIKNEKKVAVNSAHGVGKSFISAKIILWWLITHIPSKIITTAPTWAQVESVLWGEIRASIASSPILTELIPKKSILNTEIKLAPEWYAKGISTTEKADMREFGSTKFQGYHSEFLMVVMDEAPGVENSIHIAVENLTTGNKNRILKIGNPTSPTGHFYNNCNSSQYKNIHISGFDHPNIKESKEVIPGCITKEWIEGRAEDWGENNPLYIAKVLGEFPTEGEDTVIPLDWIQNAITCEVEPDDMNILGFDVARFGDDKTIFYQIKGNKVKLKGKFIKQDTMATVGRIVNWSELEKFNMIGGDPIGVGAGVFDRIKEINSSYESKQLDKHIPIREVNFACKSLDPRYANVRAEAYGFLAEHLNPEGRRNINIPDDPELHSQLAGIKYKYDSYGRILIESKDDMKKRGLKSPDYADALAIAVYCFKFLRQPRKLIEELPIIHKEFYEHKQKQKKSLISSVINKL